MTAPLIKGWCPGALRPMLSGDGWIVRIRPRLGALSASDARAIAALALSHGSGWLDISARANLQLRGVREAGIGALVDGIAALGLIDADADAEMRRNILVTPFREPGDDSTTIAAQMESLLAATDAPEFPAKFGFAVDCGSTPVLAEASADIRIERGGDGGLICRPDGSNAGAAVTAATAAASALDLARWFVASGGGVGGRGRMAAHLAGGATPPPEFVAAQSQPQIWQPRPGASPQGVLVALAFGQIHAGTLAALAELGGLRLTPWRMLLIEGASAIANIPGVIADPDDPLLRVIACTGAPGCAQAHQPTRALAASLAGRIGGLLHVSGCAKGCAHSGRAATLVGTAAGFDLVRAGTAHDPPDIAGLAPDPTLIATCLS